MERMGKMTLTELQALSPAALNERAAKCMGWELDGDGRYNAEFRELVNYKVEYWSEDTHWNPSGNLIQAAELEAEIARRGLQDVYFQTVQELWRNVPDSVGYAWFLMTVSPDLRTVAAVLTLQGEKQK